MHGDMQACQEWERIGFNYLDSLGLKWYDEPPPMVIEFREGVPSRDVFVRGNRGQWMFFWMCFNNWEHHSAYRTCLFDREDPIDGWFRWGSTMDQTTMSRMDIAYRLWNRT